MSLTALRVRHPSDQDIQNLLDEARSLRDSIMLSDAEVLVAAIAVLDKQIDEHAAAHASGFGDDMTQFSCVQIKMMSECGGTIVGVAVALDEASQTDA